MSSPEGVMASLQEEDVGVSPHVVGKEPGMFLMSEESSESAHVMGKQLGVSLVSEVLIVSLHVAGKEPDVSLMMVPGDDEACASEAGDTEAEEGEASAEDSAGFEDEAIDASEAAVAGKQTPTFEFFKSRNRIRMGFVMTFNVQKMKRITVELFKSLNIAH